MAQSNEVDQKVGSAIEAALKGKYERKHAVGRGAYGEVWLVTRISDAKNCVAKVMMTEKMHRYEQEVQCLATCSHFGIVSLVDTAMSSIGPVIILEFADGGDLSKFIKTSGSTNKLLDERTIGNWFLQLTLAVHHIHTNRMMHRDIKSANVLMQSNGFVKLSDFGFSRQFDGTVTDDVADTFLGTPYYLAPELWKRQKYSKKADVWSLGVVLYELMTLKRPFVSSSMRGLMTAICNGEFEAPPPSYSDGLRDILHKMLMVDPAKRPSTAELLNTPAMKNIAKQFKESVEQNDKVHADEKAAVLATLAKQVEQLNDQATVAASAADVDDAANEERVIMEGTVQIGSLKEWKPRYVVLNDQALVVTRVKEDRRSQQLLLNTIVKVAPADASAGDESHSVLIVSLDTGYTVWIKASDTEERNRWVDQIQAAREKKKASN